MSERMFPVLLEWRDKKLAPDCLREIPWSAIAPYDDQAQKNHQQSLERLAQRGGLTPIEITYVCCRTRYQHVGEENYQAALANAVLFLQHLASMDSDDAGKAKEGKP